MTAVEAVPRRTAAPAPPERRPDIEGLRAIAIILVLLFHAAVPGMQGGFVGVDVFFVISGFLITGLLVREAGRTGSVDLPRFWARRARRLLPAATLVLVWVAVSAAVFLPRERWRSVAGDLWASAFYAVNWVLSDREQHLAASVRPVSPVAHFWSLAVEEQFYLVWPLLLVGLLLLGKRMRWPSHRVLLAGIAALGIPSLVCSVVLTSRSRAEAYFPTTTRLWELAVGAVLAIWLASGRALPVRWASVTGLSGLACIVAAGLLFGDSTAVPGYHVLLPTLGTAAVLAAGAAHSGNSAARLLSLAPLQKIGALSYSLYLWHWPLLFTAWAAVPESQTPDRRYWWIPVVLSGIPAWLSYRYVERPIHVSPALARSSSKALLLGAACMATAVAAAGTLAAFA